MSPPSPVVLATAGEITGDGQPPTIRLESAACVDRSRSLRAVIADEDGVACERLVVRRGGAPLAPGAWSASCTAAIEAEVAITIPIGGEDTWPGAEHAIEIGAEDGSGQGTVHEAQVVVCAPLQALRTTFAARPGRGTIALDLAFSRPVTLEVTWVSALGRLLRKDLRAAGAEHHVVWDGRDSNGKPSASGVYWIRMRAQAESGESWQADRKAVLLR
jgi:hypothetical protein